MNELELLLESRWILKNKHKEQYYRIRDEVAEIRKFATDKLGCQIIENAMLVKMEKIPAIPESFMGIEAFTSQIEYGFLCAILMFLEDKEAEEQFVLSQLTEYIQGNMSEYAVDWTVYSVRCKLIRVLKYVVEQGILLVTDGDEDGFRDEADGEVLYENTGVSRYFMRHFQRDIMEYRKSQDFYESDWLNMDQDRGMIRRHRVYKRILFQPGMFREGGSEEDFEYLKYYGRRLVDEIEQQFDGQVHIHKGSAFFLLGESCNMGKAFPSTGSASNVMMLCCAEIRNKVEMKEWQVEQDETMLVEKMEVERLIRMIKEKYGNGFKKEYREMPEGKFIEEIMEELCKWTFMRIIGNQVRIYPICGKIVGAYPEDFVVEGR